jgi:hypothetical protein
MTTPNSRPCVFPWWTSHDPPDSPWDLYGSWELWMQIHWQEQLPDNDVNPFDDMDGVAKAYLYSIMCRLVEGVEFPR